MKCEALANEHRMDRMTFVRPDCGKRQRDQEWGWDVIQRLIRIDMKFEIIILR